MTSQLIKNNTRHHTAKTLHGHGSQRVAMTVTQALTSTVKLVRELLMVKQFTAHVLFCEFIENVHSYIYYYLLIVHF